MGKIDFKKLTQLQKTLFALGVALILAAVSYFLVVHPSLLEIESVNLQIEQQKLETQKKLTQGLTVNKLLEDIKNFESKVAQLNKIYVPQNRELELITYLEGVAAKHGVEQAIDIKYTEIGQRDFVKLTIQFNSSGQYANLMSYLEEIELSKYQINIADFNLQNNGGVSSVNYIAEAYINKLDY